MSQAAALPTHVLTPSTQWRIRWTFMYGPDPTKNQEEWSVYEQIGQSPRDVWGGCGGI